MDLSLQLHVTALENVEKTAYIFQDQPVTYGQLDAQITRFANGLKSLGVEKGDHVALLLGNSPHFIIGLYGALRIGARVIPINPIYTPDEIGYILHNGDVKVVIALDKLLPFFDQLTAKVPNVKHVILCESSSESEIEETHEKMKSFTSVMHRGTDQFDFPEISEQEVAIILYTSGTTGKPKGAMLTHHNLYRNAKDVADFLHINHTDRVVATLPMFHVFGLTVSLNAPLMNGGIVLVVPKFSPAEVFRLIKEYEATIFVGVPTMYNFLLNIPNVSAEQTKSLRLCISGGSAMPVALLQSFEQKFQVVVSEGYGLSEASPVTCFNPLDRPRKAGSIGTSIANVQNRVVNEFGEEVAAGEVGELIVRGPNVMKGYYNMPEETAHAIRDGWLYTGDLAKMDDEGYFYIVDRKKDLIIVGGFNVYPREVEEVLYRHPDVSEVAVLGIPHPDQGEAVKCFVVVKNQETTKEELIRYCSEHLAKYKVPYDIEFLDELPKNTTGKILRRSLKQQLLNK